MSETFTDDEIETLRKGAMGSGLLVSASDRGFFDTFKEAGALVQARLRRPEHVRERLVKQVAESHGTGFGVTTSVGQGRVGDARRAPRVGGLLKAKAPDELEAYRAFVLELARSVAAAAPGGDEAEAAAVAKIESALA